MILLNEGAALGMKLARRMGGEIRVQCPVHGGSQPSLGIRMKGNKVVWCCHAGCDGKEVMQSLMEMGVIERTGRMQDYQSAWARGNQAQAQKQIELGRQIAKRKWMKGVWEGSTADLPREVFDYFQGRSIDYDVCVSAFRPGNVRWSDKRKCLVARVTDSQSNGIGLHITNILTGDRKCHGTTKGGIIRLFDPSNGPPVAIAEGLETAIAYAQMTGMPTSSAINANGIASFSIDDFGPVDGIHHLTVAADFDGAGITAFERCKRLNERHDVVMDLPNEYGQDWNDKLIKSTELWESLTND